MTKYAFDNEIGDEKKFSFKIFLFCFKSHTIEIDDYDAQQPQKLPGMEDNRSKPRSSHLNPEEINLKDRSVSRSSSVATIHDEIQDTLQLLLNRQRDIENDQKVTNEWRSLATRIDKILFYIFLLLTIISTLGLLVIVPLFRSKVQQKSKLWNGTRRN